MTYEVHVQQVEPQLTAVVRRCAAPDQLSTAIPQACGEVWNFVRAAQLPNPGRHLALYLDGAINFECGAEVSEPFTGDGQVVCSTTPAGMVATTTHFGRYDRLGEAHQAIRDWCAAQGHALAGLNWEVYGHWDSHWDDDPAKIRTDVFYLLADTKPDA